MKIIEKIASTSIQAVETLYGQAPANAQIQVSLTSKDFEGDFTLVVFPLLKLSRKKPEDTAQDIGAFLAEHVEEVEGFNVVKGFLNLVIADDHWVNFLEQHHSKKDFGKGAEKNSKVVLEYCGPNTNKPLHLGHVRNMVLGYSVAEILAWNGYDVHKVNIYNDRGIAICKSMIAWVREGKNATPESTRTKGDHLMGHYYVLYDQYFKQEVAELTSGGETKEAAEKQAPIFKEAQEELLKWEANDPETIALWKQMNGWVYEGFNQTFSRIGVDFEKDYYESATYLLGKEIVQEGLDKGVYYQREDGSVWVDLTSDGLDEKILIRSDGTSVYLTQDLGTAQLRYDDFQMDRSIYTVADEQNYHFKVLKLALQKLGKPYADGIYHLSYGLVELPHGRMKSREGNVVDADDLMEEMYQAAKAQSEELGKLDEMSEDEANQLFEIIGIGALKYFMLRVSPPKKMVFNPEESIDLNGQTASFIQYSYTRIQSVLRKAGATNGDIDLKKSLRPAEKELLFHLHQYPSVCKEAAQKLDPSEIATYVYYLAKYYNKFYTECPILKDDVDLLTRNFRLKLSGFTANVIQSALKLMGIDAPDRM